MKPLIELISLKKSFIALLDNYKNDSQYRSMVANATEHIVNLERRVKILEDFIDNYPLFQWINGDKINMEDIVGFVPPVSRVSKADTILPF